MRVIGLLLMLVHRTLFQLGEEGLRRCHPLASTALLLSGLVALKAEPSWTPAVLIILSVGVLGTIAQGGWWTLSAVTLSSVPGAWYAITAAIIPYLGLSAPLPLPRLITIYLRATSVSLILLYYLASLSPISVANALARISPRASIAVHLTWRIMPYGVKNATDSLELARLKSESIRNRIAPAVASILDIGHRIREGAWIRLDVEPKLVIPREASLTLSTANLVLASLVLLASLL